MDLTGTVAPAAGALFLIAVLCRLFRAPIRLILRVGLNSLLGYAALWILRLTAPLTGVSLGLSAGNALVIAILGLPGLGLLLLLQWLFT